MLEVTIPAAVVGALALDVANPELVLKCGTVLVHVEILVIVLLVQLVLVVIILVKK